MVPQRYAKSLLLAAKETGEIDTVLDEVKKVESYLKDENIKRLLISPATLRQHKLEVIDLMSKDLNLSNLMMNFLKLLVNKKRIELIDDIISYFYLYYQKEMGIERVIIITADEISEEKLETIKKKLEEAFGKKFEVEVKRDENKLLGIEIIGKDWRISCSARDMLRQFAALEV